MQVRHGEHVLAAVIANALSSMGYVQLFTIVRHTLPSSCSRERPTDLQCRIAAGV